MKLVEPYGRTLLFNAVLFPVNNGEVPHEFGVTGKEEWPWQITGNCVQTNISLIENLPSIKPDKESEFN